jgi:hypothetical protein
MPTITPYTPKLRALTPMVRGMGFDETKKKFIKFKGEYQHWEVLDALSAAAEAGCIDSDTWVKTVFSSKKAFHEFLENLETSDMERFHDRWALALKEITGCMDDGYCVTGAEAASTFLDHAQETGQA